MPYTAILRSWAACSFDLGGSEWTSGGSCPFSAWWFESENLKEKSVLKTVKKK